MTDLVWQEDDGRVAIWYMDGTTKTAEIEVGINPGAAWRVVGTGDLDDDGCSDIVFQNGVAVAGYLYQSPTFLTGTYSVGVS